MILVGLLVGLIIGWMASKKSYIILPTNDVNIKEMKQLAEVKTTATLVGRALTLHNQLLQEVVSGSVIRLERLDGSVKTVFVE